MTALPFPTFDLEEPEILSILEIYNSIKTKFSAQFDFDFTFVFKDFELFRYYENNDIGPVICLHNNAATFYITFTQVTYQYSGVKGGARRLQEYQIWGVAFLKNNFGHVLIKPESFLDKIHELINPVELVFQDDKEFSKNYYVVTNDALKATLQITQSFRDNIQNIQVKDFLIEIIDNKLIIGNKKIIETNPALEFVDFMDKVSKFF